MTKKSKSKTMSFGAVVYATALPAQGGVSIVGSVAGGSIAAKSEELAQVHAHMLMEGTAKHSKKDIQLMLDSWGAELAFVAGVDRLKFVARVPTRHAGKLLALIAEILAAPAFPPTELAILKKREQASLAMEAQDTREQARIALARLIYPKAHPSYAESTKESAKVLGRINQQALKRFHTSTHGARSLILSAAGDITPAALFALVEKHFKALPTHTLVAKKVRPIKPRVAHKALVRIPNKASIDYLVGTPTGITSKHEDYPALILAMQVLGSPSGFTGRLMKTVREEEGLTYGVYAYLQNFGYRTDGMLAVWGTFAPQLFKQGRAAIAREIKKIVEGGVSDDEVRRHAEMFAARAIVNFSNSSSIARIVHDTIADHRPLSYIDDLPKKILKLSAKEINKVLKKYLVPGKLSQSAAGPVEKKAFSS